MPSFKVQALNPLIADEVRRTRLSPGYGHPAVSEMASGTGPCRSCLRLFNVGVEERLLFTYQPWSGDQTVGAPGPVFIHSAGCDRFDGRGLPLDLLTLPLLVEGRTGAGEVLLTETVIGLESEGAVERCLSDPKVDFVFLRHGEAGCHIARVDRVDGFRSQ